jgi:CheY-like chemotaxis protein
MIKARDRSKFIVRPREKKEGHSHKAGRESKMSKVLVVDDVYSELELICRILREAGMDVAEARNGEEAIARIRENLPDVVILDVIMPGMNGFEVIRELRDDPKTKNLPVVFCSQKNTEIDKVWGMELGADAYLTKPFEPQQLLHIVERLS